MELEKKTLKHKNKIKLKKTNKNTYKYPLSKILISDIQILIKFSGWSLHVACATFSSIQVCGIVNMIAFLRRYNRIEDILKIVPGLTDKIDRYLIKKARHQLPVHQHDHYRHPHSPHVNYDWQVDRPVFEFEWPLESPEEAEDFEVDEMESDGLMKSDWTLDTGVDDDLRGGEKRDYDILHENGDLFTEV